MAEEYLLKIHHFLSNNQKPVWTYKDVRHSTSSGISARFNKTNTLRNQYFVLAVLQFILTTQLWRQNSIPRHNTLFDILISLENTPNDILNN